ncbi:MAG: M20/M25/M40 family metallo-hydrolase [Coriobacteriales bacterium]|jgi:tripeptide aminopeptidase|nr:M20/M25/M40 family metallo-hydrolase [Coriobacteriales bacterium]
MNAKRLLDTFLELVRIDSPSLREAEVAAWCQAALEQAGCTVRFDDSATQTGSDTGNLIAILPAKGDAAEGAGSVTTSTPSSALSTPAPRDNSAPALYFSAHMDTVSPGEGIEPVISDGIIRSAGATVLGGDDKVGVAAIIELVRTLAESDKPHPAVGVLLSVGEEIGLRGARAMNLDAGNGEPCFVLDANGSPGVVIIGAPFHYLFTATFSGRAAHAGIEPEKGISAIALASKAVLGMELGRLDEHTTANVGTISGGNAFNIVPDTCVVTGEFRAMGEARALEVKAQIGAAIDAAIGEPVEGSGVSEAHAASETDATSETDAAHNGAATSGSTDVPSVTVEWEEEYRGFSVSASDPLVQLVLSEARALGFPAQALVTGGGSDANIFAEKGLRPLVLGTGMTNVHSPSESLAVKDLEDLTRLCIALTYACA